MTMKIGLTSGPAPETASDRFRLGVDGTFECLGQKEKS
jgi:hypothetical protein